jgi:hypothetical protein
MLIVTHLQYNVDIPVRSIVVWRQVMPVVHRIRMKLVHRIRMKLVHSLWCVLDNCRQIIQESNVTNVASVGSHIKDGGFFLARNGAIKADPRDIWLWADC